MTKRQQNRIASLMPGGIPKYIRVWDTGSGPTIDDPLAPEGSAPLDRYTVCYTGRYPKGKPPYVAYSYVGMNSVPFHPMYGICQHGESMNAPIDCPNGWAEQVGRKCRHNPSLGRRIRFGDLPDDCRRVVLEDYCELWGLPMPEGAPEPSIKMEVG